MAPACPRLVDVRTGHARRIDGHVTAYAKQSRSGPVAVHPLGLEGDEVANTRVHGGPEKAVYAYAAGNYPLWIVDHPIHAERFAPGAFGENLLIEGLDETSVCIGDKWQIGSALMQPCQPRQPCATLARWFGDPAMVKAMVANGRSGWYLRVVEPGTIAAGDTLSLAHRPEGAWTIEAVLKASYTPSGPDELRALSEAPGLAASWASWASRAAGAGPLVPKPL